MKRSRQAVTEFLIWYQSSAGTVMLYLALAGNFAWLITRLYVIHFAGLLLPTNVIGLILVLSPNIIAYASVLVLWIYGGKGVQLVMFVLSLMLLYHDFYSFSGFDPKLPFSSETLPLNTFFDDIGVLLFAMPLLVFTVMPVLTGLRKRGSHVD